ncbi:hypothetical protein Dimus_012379 [Dionaea muscipula]
MDVDIVETGPNNVVIVGQQPNEPPHAPHRLKSHIMAILGSLLLQAIISGNSLITKAAFSHSMRPSIYTLYRNIVASAVLWAWVLCKRSLPPRPSWETWMWIVLLAILEPALDQNLFYAGAKETPAGFSACIAGITPAATFFFAWLLQMEKVDCKKYNRFRIFGALLMIGGAMALFYHGKQLSISKSSKTHAAEFREANQNWIVGPAYLLGAVLCYIVFNLLMGKVLKSYPSPMGVTLYCTSIGAVLDTFMAMGVWHKEKGFWKITPNITLAAYLYGGIFSTAIAFWLLGKLIQMRGPIFVTSFSPLEMVIVMLIGVLVLGEAIYVGSIIGLAIIVTGFALFQWGEYQGAKATQQDEMNNLSTTEANQM